LISTPITDTEFSQLAALIKTHYGIHLKYEKKAMLAGRLHQLLQRLQLDSFSDYYRYLLADRTGSAAAELINHISTNHTFFMRETSHFDYLRYEALPALQKQIKDRDLRIWCAGCSTGEEPYTLAMIIDEYFGANKHLWDTSLLATDISTKALEQAIQGSYSADTVSPLPPVWKSNYLRRMKDGRYSFADFIKREIVFRKFNLIESRYPFKRRFHAIFCRNVMIYFDAPTKDALIRRFYNATEPGGYLFIGHSESLERNQYGYQYVMPSVYRKP